jgi:hypothetical protein
MKRKQISDERLAALLTEAYDARLDAAEGPGSAKCRQPVNDQQPGKAFPLGGRWREATDEGRRFLF